MGSGPAPQAPQALTLWSVWLWSVAFTFGAWPTRGQCRSTVGPPFKDASWIGLSHRCSPPRSVLLESGALSESLLPIRTVLSEIRTKTVPGLSLWRMLHQAHKRSKEKKATPRSFSTQVVVSH